MLADAAQAKVWEDYTEPAGGAVWLDDTPVAVIDRTSGSAVTAHIQTGQLYELLALTDGS